MARRIYLYDTTLRDGAQTQGVDFGPADKIAIAKALDDLGIDYIEGGWPGANPTDDAFFASPPSLRHARLAAFGMTRRAGRSAANDPGLMALTRAGTPSVCIVGKAWDYHVTHALEITLEDNLAMIGQSIRALVEQGKEVLFDAEHFFDGYKANHQFAGEAIRTAVKAGARWVVLCDTNGGTLPHEVTQIVTEVASLVPGEKLGIHCHDDTGNAVANSLAAVQAGAAMIQGTINGLGERCGNANLVSLIPSLKLKLEYELGVDDRSLRQLTSIAHLVDERLNRAPDRQAPYVGDAAFTHKGGLHVSAVAKNPRTYEHIDPALVGNRRHVVVSDQAGRSNILARLKEVGIDLDPNRPEVGRLLETVKAREFEGYAYDGAAASFELLAKALLGRVPDYFRLQRFRVMDDRRWNARDDLVTESEAIVTITIAGQEIMAVADGNGPVNALDAALRKGLLPSYPILADMALTDYKVRILTPGGGTASVTRVLIESKDASGQTWTTVGVSANIIDASYAALYDAFIWKLLRHNVAAIAYR